MTREYSDFSTTQPAVPPRRTGVPIAAARPVATRRRRRNDWRLGGQAVSSWGIASLSWSVGLVGTAAAAAVLVDRTDLPWSSPASLGLLWAGMVLAIFRAFRRGRPAGLLRFRATDLIWGVGIGLAARLFAGALSDANQSPFPGAGMSHVETSELSDLVGIGIAGLGGAIVEEAFFRAVVLVAIFETFRRSVGSVAAGVTAGLGSAGAFVVLHGVFDSLTLSDGFIFFLLGIAGSCVVLLTGRLWGTIALHLTYNASYLALITMGALLS